MAYLDMTNSSHQCPGDMEEVTLSGKRVCGRSASASQSCASATFSSNELQYSQVCGKINGYQYGDTTAFGFYTYTGASQSIESWYVDGVSVTHGPPGRREHVWTFANGLSQNRATIDACPCAPNAVSNIKVPPFIGQDYFCESGAITDSDIFQFFPDDPLWDGDGCTAGNNCCEFNDPPYFTKHLTNPTNNDLEVRACGDNSRSNGRADTLVEVIELYIK